ncbi:MAG TPA: class I SAM-dependent methyltransferase [Acidimicrobiia bacterium]|nr:class I SAM-dependent methyltransferase [Acidimicrobiia bacterium]
MFDRRGAERLKRGYRRHGLDNMASNLVEYLIKRGVSNRTVLEVGGGIGDLQIELLKAGAAQSVNVELSHGYEAAAAELIEAEGMNGRVERLLGDFVGQSDAIEKADVVVLNRVVCCYPWMQPMIEAVTAKTGWLLALSVPRDHFLSHTMVGIGNSYNRLRRCGFRAFVHAMADIEAVATNSGFTQVFSETGLVWRGMVFERI